MDRATRKKFIELTQRRIKPGSGSSVSFLTARTWTHPVANISNLLTVPYTIVGGVATRLYMPERKTPNLDILIHTASAAQLYPELATTATRLGELSFGGTSWQLADRTLLSILTESRQWVTEALTKPNFAPDGQPIIALPYLVIMKLATSRTSDLGDLSRMLGQASELELARVKSIIAIYDRESLEDLESLIQLGRLEFET